MSGNTWCLFWVQREEAGGWGMVLYVLYHAVGHIMCHTYGWFNMACYDMVWFGKEWLVSVLYELWD